MNNIFLKTMSLSDTWQKLSEDSLVLTVTLAAPPENVDDIEVRVGGNITVMPPGASTERWYSIDLSAVEARGNVNNKLVIDGGSW